MNAIYARQSVDRADSISIESQIEFCQYEMRGEQYKVYTDRGYSGKNTDRPAFAEMMNDIESGVIGKVVVYKLDRISRSTLRRGPAPGQGEDGPEESLLRQPVLRSISAKMPLPSFQKAGAFSDSCQMRMARLYAALVACHILPGFSVL